VLALRAPEVAPHFRLNARASNILERALRGERQKAIAIDLGITDAAVANTLAQCRRKLGFTCRSAELPIAFVLLAQAAANGRDVRVSAGSAPDELVIGFERLDTSRLRSLTRAEAEVISGLIHGLSQQEIARERKARRRTVVNQLATARRKLPVSGRVELVRFLSQLPQHEPKRAEALAPVHREALHAVNRRVA
jgi:DNA-binding CsgD family transcriptional regulator